MSDLPLKSSVAKGRPGDRIYPKSPVGESVPGVATGRDVEWEPLVDYRRNGVSETTIHGAVAWAHGRDVFHSFGGNVLCYGRSMMKPFTMKVFAEELAGVLDDRQKAISVSSHNGDTEHVAAAQSILTESEWGLMQTPLDVPLVQFGRQVRRPRRWYHTCSGEHAAILRGARLKGWPRAGYTLPGHPLFPAFIEVLQGFLGADWQPLRVARDGCGLPTVSNTVAELATLFAGLAAEKDQDWIWESTVNHPDLIGGFNRLDSTVIKAGGGKVMAKEGADGLLGLSVLHDDYPEGLGIVVKIAHGWNSQATWYVARAVLGVLGFSLRNPYPLHRQKAFIVPGVVPERYRDALEETPTWDEWDPDSDRWYYDLGQMESLLHFIDGKAVPSADGRTFANTAPATGEVVSEVARGGAAEVECAARAARSALAGPWGRTTVAERADLLERAADLIEQRIDDLARIESRDTGKTLTMARTVDIPRAVANLRFFAGAIRHDETGFHHMGSALNYTLRKPVGVVGLISPWNLPLYLLSWKTGPALAMGNAVVAKPSEMTPGTATALAEILFEAGFPAGAFNLVHGFGPEAGQALVEHPEVKAVSFTGGTETGRRVAATAAPLFKKLSLELGGKNPTIVFADSDFETAVNGTVRASFLNQGQICLCGSRILVQRAIYPAFVEKFVALTRELVIGDPASPDTFLGSLVSLDHREKVESYLALAREEGGEVLCGGERPDLPPPFHRGAFLTPAIVAGLPSDCRTATEEIFGPVVTIHPFDDEEEALAIANGVDYGLSASIWTMDLDRAHRVGAALQSGLVWVNTWLLRDLRTPFGGVKASGVGREGGRWSLDFFSETQNICIKLSEEVK